MKRTESVANLNEAFAKWLKERPELKKDATVKVTSKRTDKSYNFKYATLGNIIRTYSESLGEKGLSVNQEVNEKGVYTFLEHESGEWKLFGPLPIKLKDMEGNNLDEQEIGSSITYKKRYQLNAVLFADAEEDDDANSADGNDVSKGSTSKPKQKQTKKSKPKKAEQPKKQQQQSSNNSEPNPLKDDDKTVQEWLNNVEDAEQLVNWYQKYQEEQEENEFLDKWHESIMQRMDEIS